MNTAQDLFQRLLRIEQLLTQTVTLGGGNVADPARTREDLAKRIRLLTDELKQHDGRDADVFDAITMRLLLNDFVLLISSLRALGHDAEMKLLAAGGALKDSRRRFEQQHKLQLRREAREAER